MTDCPRADIRDMLPDWVHGTLDASSRALVSAHVAQCADCAAESDLLRAARVVLARAPRIDTERIAAAVNAVRRQPRESRRRWPAVAGILAVAAGIAVVMFGGPVSQDSGVMTAGADSGAYSVAPARTGYDTSSQLAVADTAEPMSATGIPKPTLAAGQLQIVMGGGIADLGDQELEALLSSLDGVDAIPSAVPEPFMILPVGTSVTEGLL